MKILGTHWGHDGHLCLVDNGKLTHALASERITRNRKCHGVGAATLDYFLESSGLDLATVDAVALSDWSPLEWIVKDSGIEVFKDGEPAPCAWNHFHDGSVGEYTVKLRGKTYPAYHISHHLAHCAAAYYTSPFQEAACFSLDASGGLIKSNSVIAHGLGTQLNQITCPGLMVGIAYGFFTEWLGLGPQIHKAGSLMGLAAHGVPFEHVVANIDGYVDRCFHTEESAYNQWMADLWNDLAKGAEHFAPDQNDSDRAKDIAATIQLIFERSVLRAVSMYVLSPNVCLGGGSFLNCNVNTAIHNTGKNVHLFPACGDDGLAVGTALYLAHHVFGEPRHSYDDQEICYLGRDHPVKEIAYDFLAKELEHGKAIAWCNGRSEYGPRALGNRSILLEPTCADNLQRVNSRIKNREWFRPLAPSVLAEHAPDWFEGGPAKSPFMLHTAQSKTKLVPAVTHVDGSSRIQTVTAQSNPHYYRLIETYRQRTGIPMLLNTSLNVNGEPIVETAEDAKRFFAAGTVDHLVLNGEVFSK